jgi:hypothetical protein
MNNDDKEFFSRIKKGDDSKFFIMLSKRRVPNVPPLHLQDVNDDKAMNMIDKRLAYWDKIKEDFRREFGFMPVELAVYPIKQFSMTMWETASSFTEPATMSWKNTYDTTDDTIPEDAVRRKCYGYSVIIGNKKHKYLNDEVSKRYVIDFLKSDKHNSKVRDKFMKPLLGPEMSLFFYTIMNRMAHNLQKSKGSWYGGGSNRKLEA